MELDELIYDFFQTKGCSIEETQSGAWKIQLTEAMDRALMNRPFYWHYMKQIGQVGVPAVLTLHTDPHASDKEGELIHFGSHRYQQIVNYLQTNERVTMLYERVSADKQTPLFPWLVINMKVSYQGKQKRDEIFSIGLHLINGKMVKHMMDHLSTIPMEMTMSDYCYTISPIISYQSGFKRIEKVLTDYIHEQEHQWADESRESLQHELSMLEHFFEDSKEDDDRQLQLKEMEKNALLERYVPSIHMQVINGGLFYLTE